MAAHTYMAIDQYGRTYHDLGRYPRKALLAHFGVQHADKLYCDDRAGQAWHCGYVIAGHWLTLYAVTPFRKAA